jgi:hypothetical protein
MGQNDATLEHYHQQAYWLKGKPWTIYFEEIGEELEKTEDENDGLKNEMRENSRIQNCTRRAP